LDTVGTVTVRNAWQAITLQPLSFLASSWPWRSLAYLLSGVLVGAATGLSLLLLAVGTVFGTLAVVGLVGLLGLAFSGIVVARVERRRLRLVDIDPAPDPHRRPDRPGWRGWLRTRLREQSTWREFGYMAVSALGLWWIDLGVVGFSLGVPTLFIISPIVIDPPQHWWYGLPAYAMGAVLIPVAAYSITAWAGARAALTRAILSPRDDELGAQLVEVARSRARLVDAFEVERRRIERDLHDGAQQRLVALSVSLGLAELDLPPDSPAARQVAEAHQQARLALAELRELIRGVHPHVLTDRGLAAAVTDLAGRSPVPTQIDIELPRRLPQGVEVTAYFAIAEALANVVKHGRASRAAVHGRLLTDMLVVEVRDDGIGGADPAVGSGLAGLADRVAVAEGRLLLSSPVGGPTLVRVELPCTQTVHSG
jgi:signal transduction histidine kinase